MTLAMHRAVVHEFLLTLRNEDIVFFPNPGNAGDALIAAGTRAAFMRAGLSPEQVEPDADVTGKTVILGGGGSMIGSRGEYPDAIRAFVKRAARLVILPHSVREVPELLELLGSNVTVFVRDLNSYRVLAKNCDKPTVYLAPDMAFHLDAEEFLADPEIAPSGQRWFDNLIKHNKLDFDAVMAAPRAYYARTDWEKNFDIGGQHFDVSNVFAFGIWGERGMASAWCLLNAVRQAKAVASDRLHVGISAALLGKDCDLFDNIYGKNSSIYDYSIKYSFPHVRLISRKQ